MSEVVKLPPIDPSNRSLIQTLEEPNDQTQKIETSVQEPTASVDNLIDQNTTQVEHHAQSVNTGDDKIETNDIENTEDHKEKPIISGQGSLISGINDRATAADEGLENSTSSLIISGRDKEQVSLLNKIKQKDTNVKPIQKNKVTPETVGKGSTDKNVLNEQAKVIKLLNQAVERRFTKTAVMPLELQGYMRDIHQYHGPVGCRFWLIKLMSKPPYDVFMGVLCCLYILMLISLIVQDDYIYLDSSVQGFKFSQYGFLGAFLLDNFLNFCAYGLVYYSNDFYIILEMIGIILAGLIVYYNEQTQGDFFCRVLKICVIFRKLYTVKQKEKVHYYMEMYEKVNDESSKNQIMPQQKVVNILEFIKKNFDLVDHRLRADWLFVIRKVASGKLYEVDFDTSNPFPSKAQMKRSGMRRKSTTADVKLTNSVGMEWAIAMTKTETNKRASVNHEQHPFKTEMKSTDHKEEKSNKRMSLISKSEMKAANIKQEDSLTVTTKFVSQILQLNDKVKEEMMNIHMYDFDIFKVRDMTSNNELVTVVSYIFARENIFEQLPIDQRKFLPFLKELQKRYKNITYHNKTHAADLAQTFYYFCITGDLKTKCNLDSIEMFSYVLAGACHDVEHPGVSNIFLIESNDKIALNYNDSAVLENHHVATAFQILQRKDFNILKNFCKPEYKRIRKLMVDAILATDMAQHFNKSAQFKNTIQGDDFDPQNPEQKQRLCCQMFHLADISNTSKKFDTCWKWVELLFVEFFNQGDREKELGVPVSMFMDRCTTNIEQSQIGFIDFIIKPSFVSAHQFLPAIIDCVTNIDRNKILYEKSIPKGATRMEGEKLKAENIQKNTTKQLTIKEVVSEESSSYEDSEF